MNALRPLLVRRVSAVTSPVVTPPIVCPIRFFSRSRHTREFDPLLRKLLNQSEQHSEILREIIQNSKVLEAKWDLKFQALEKDGKMHMQTLDEDGKMHKQTLDERLNVFEVGRDLNRSATRTLFAITSVVFSGSSVLVAWWGLTSA
ncbi:hypothetical protein N0V83_009036 [Neocucurbitaria cava]|uniref:Uncharacterized protein n=1 Tax=Neocucurbitaria cava TaxID=798079 RepID=A0A9W9CIR1_9PLEO|nr:hypothetical protein N0V83_009036 [Neocucurbitaria cava]